MYVCLCCPILEMYCRVALQQGACRSEQHFGSHFSSKQGGRKRRREGVVCACMKVFRKGKESLALLYPTHVVGPVPSVMCALLSAQEVSLCVFLWHTPTHPLTTHEALSPSLSALPSHPPAQSVQDAQNYAFYLPPTSSNQKGTFLDEQLTFEDYTLIGHVPILEVSHTPMADPAGCI